MRVYRVEHRRDRSGPFQGGHAYAYDSKRGEGHPSAYDKPGPGTGESEALRDLFRHGDGEAHVFGFRSVEQLAAWFTSPEGRAALRERGFHVAIYEAGSVVEGNHQVVFRPPPAPVGALDLATLEPIGNA